MTSLLAMCTALLFALASVSAKRGLKYLTLMSGLMLSLAVTFGITVVAVVLDPPGAPPLGAVWFFALAGLIGDGLGRVSFLAGIETLGPARSIPIQTATYPLLSLVIGSAVFSESITMIQIAGVVAIVVGVWIVSFEDGTQSNEKVPGTVSVDDGKRVQRSVKFLFPVVAGASFGFSDLFRKEGLQGFSAPTFGAMIAAGTALVIWSVLGTALTPLRKQLRFGPGASWFVLSGGCTGVALITLFLALDGGDISVVGPIVAGQPLAVILFSVLFLREVEKLTRTVVIGSGLAVLGLAIVAST